MRSGNHRFDLEQILAKATRAVALDKEEITGLLYLEDHADIEKLFYTARELRAIHFGKQVFLYGFVYFSTYCRNDCAFCFYRRTNTISERYRKSKEEILETAHNLAESGVHLLDLTMGEDPVYFSLSKFDGLLETVEAVKRSTRLPVMISPGVIPRDVLADFKKLGVEWYACYQETHNRRLYNRLRLNQSYDQRFDLKIYARSLGFLIEEGLLAGIGESPEDIYYSFRAMEDLSADQIRVMSFVPQKGTPLEKWSTSNHLRELLVIAVMRLIFPGKLIPASLDVDGIAGLKQRLNAGANVITSLIPPGTGLLGVSQSTLDIQEGGRTVAGVIPVLEQCGLKPATAMDYREWIAKARSAQVTVSENTIEKGSGKRCG